MTVESSQAAAQPAGEGLSPRKSSLLRSSMIMASGTLVSRILGFIRAALLVAAIGSVGGGVMAAFQTANTLPNMVFNILAAGVLDAVLVPQIVRALRQKDGDIFVNRLLTAAGSLLFLLTVVAMIATPLLIFITAASYNAEIRALAIAFALVCLPQIFFYGIYNLLGEVLNARGVFGPYMWAPVVNNIVGITGLGVFLFMWGTHPEILPIADFTSAQFWVLAGSSTLGVICQALILIIPLRHAGVKLRPDFHFRETDFGSISRIAGWTFATLGVSQIGIFSSSNLVAAADAWANTHQPTLEAVTNASDVVVGNAAYATSFMIFMVPQSLIAVSLATAVFTRLSAAAAAHDHREVATQFVVGVRSISTLTLLAAAILTAGAIPMMQLVLPKASPLIVESYAWVLTAMLPGVASIGLILMAQRVYFAYEDAKPTFYMGIIPNILQVIVGWTFYFLFSPLWWVVGAACAEAVCRTSQGFIGLFMVQKANRFIEARPLVFGFLRSYAAAIAATFVGYGAMMLVGWHTSAESTLLKILASLGRLGFIAVVVTIAFWLMMRLISPTESAIAGQMISQRFPLPSPIRRFLIGENPPSSSDKPDNGVIDEQHHEVEGPAFMTDNPRDLFPGDKAKAASGDTHTPQDSSHVDADTGAISFEDHRPAVPYANAFTTIINDVPKPSPLGEETTRLVPEQPFTPTRVGDVIDSPPHSLPDSALVDSGSSPFISSVIDSVPEIDAAPTTPIVTPRPSTTAESGFFAALPPTEEAHSAPDFSLPSGANTATDPESLSSFSTRVSATLAPAVSATSAWLASIQLRLGSLTQATQMKLQEMRGTPSSASLPPVNDVISPWDGGASADADSSEAENGPNVTRRSVRASAPPAQPVTRNAVQGISTAPAQRVSGAHPTLPALLFFAVFTLIAFVWAVRTAFAPVNLELPQVDGFQAEQSQSASDAQSAQTTPDPVASAPKITSVSMLSWRDDQGDNENDAINMIDGDPLTEWHSRQFTGGFGDDTGITIVVKLDKPVALNQVNLTMHESTSGGEVYLLMPNAEKPRAGQKIATSSMSPSTVLKPESPVEVDSFAIRFGEVPRSVDGALWAWIYEISVE